MQRYVNLPGMAHPLDCMAINAEKFAPAIADHYLGRTGYDSQMTDKPMPPNRSNNLWEPLPGDHGAHGRFDAQAHNRSWQLELDMHRGAVLAGIIGMAAGIFALFRRAETRQAEIPAPAQPHYDVA